MSNEKILHTGDYLISQRVRIVALAPKYQKAISLFRFSMCHISHLKCQVKSSQVKCPMSFFP